MKIYANRIQDHEGIGLWVLTFFLNVRIMNALAMLGSNPIFETIRIHFLRIHYSTTLSLSCLLILCSAVFEETP